MNVWINSKMINPKLVAMQIVKILLALFRAFVPAVILIMETSKFVFSLHLDAEKLSVLLVVQMWAQRLSLIHI